LFAVLVGVPLVILFLLVVFSPVVLGIAMLFGTSANHNKKGDNKS